MSISKKSQNPILPRVDHIDLTVKNLSETKKFYTELFVNFCANQYNQNMDTYLQTFN